MSGIIDNPRDSAIRRVADVLRQQAAPKRLFVIDDHENIEQAVLAGVVLDAVFVSEDAPAGAAVEAAEAAEVPVHVITDAVAKSLFGREKRSRVFALAAAPRPANLTDLTEGDIVVLDGVRLAGNIGAITRTATAFGAGGVVLIDSGLQSVLDRRIVRASRGTVFALPVVLASAADARAAFDAAGVPLVALAAGAGASPITRISGAGDRVALLMGSERTGASDALEASATQRYAIDMDERVESLNVSVAAAIALHERRR